MSVSRLHLTFWSTLILCSGLAVAGRPDGGYHLLKKYDLGAAPGGKEYWDYITFEPSTHRLYISHNPKVKVVDADNGAIVGSIPDLKRVHGIAVLSDQFGVVETVKTEFGARNMALDPKTHRLFIDNADFTPAPEPTAEQPHPQPTPVSGTFRLLVYGH
jgi:hypothetical protein